MSRDYIRFNVEAVSIGNDLVCTGCTAGIKHCVHVPFENRSIFCEYYRGSTFTKEGVFQVACTFKVEDSV